MQTILIEKARDLAGKFSLNGFEGNSAGEVAAALITKDGNIYTGICIDVACSLGFCAEHAAIAEMLKNRETEVAIIVAITDKGKIIPPCGRCREILVQINKKNLDAQVVIDENKIISLNKLLPYCWSIWKLWKILVAWPYFD